MNIKDLHSEAINLAKNANVFLNDGNFDEYKRLTLDAYNLEKQAAEQLKERKDIEPTRSVLYRSAATLAFKCEKYSESIDLITQALSGNPFEEIKLELLDLLKQIVGIKSESLSTIKSNNYLDSLRDRSVNIKLEEKSGKYSGAFVVSHVVEFLKNINQSYQNYAEAQFIKTINKESLPNFDFTLNKFKKGCNLLGTELNFSSFGISISADKSVMDTFDVYTTEFKEMKSNLFSEFKEDVIYPRYDDPNFQKRISEKFSEDERRKIFTPVVNSISKSKDYKISVTDDDYKNKIKEFAPLNTKTKQTLIPAYVKETLAENEDTSLTKKIEQTKGSKKTVILSEQIKYLEQEISIESIDDDKKKIYLNSPHIIVLIFEMNYYRIEDNLYKINVSGKDFHDVVAMYKKHFIANYSELLSNKNNLSIDETELLEVYESTTVRDW